MLCGRIAGYSDALASGNSQGVASTYARGD
jgi:hypothetical protein